MPLESLKKGSATLGATADVLTAYRVINEAGGIVIATHANSSNGVAMRGLDFGGQTRIAYTQDPGLHVLEVTDLDKRGRYTTRRFFDGSKPEYPRPMRCIQGSDAHRLIRENPNSKLLGIGDRVTEILLREVSFTALAEVLKGNDLSLTRPYRGPATPIDFVQLAREEGESIVQSFHAAITQRGGHLDRVLQDVCAMANGNGGTIYIGVSAKPKEKPVGVRDHSGVINRLQETISNRISPDPNLHIDNLPSQGNQIVRITVQPGQEAPYAIDDNRFYIRDDTETSLAVRDEIVRLVQRRLGHTAEVERNPRNFATPATHWAAPAANWRAHPRRSYRGGATAHWRGDCGERKTPGYLLPHRARFAQRQPEVKNVTRSSARKLWHYAITQVESGIPKPAEISWQGNIAVLDVRRKNDGVWYDLAMRDDDTVHYFYGVTDSGLNDNWLALIEKAQ